MVLVKIRCLCGLHSEWATFESAWITLNLCKCKYLFLRSKYFVELHIMILVLLESIDWKIRQFRRATLTPITLKMNLCFIIHNSIYTYLENTITYYAFIFGENYTLLLGICEDAFNSNNHIGLNDKEVYAHTSKGSRGRVAPGLFIQVLKCWHWGARMFSILITSLWRFDSCGCSTQITMSWKRKGLSLFCLLRSNKSLDRLSSCTNGQEWVIVSSINPSQTRAMD